MDVAIGQKQNKSKGIGYLIMFVVRFNSFVAKEMKVSALTITLIITSYIVSMDWSVKE